MLNRKNGFFEESTGVYSPEPCPSAEDTFFERLYAGASEKRKQNLRRVVQKVFWEELTSEERAVAADYYLQRLTLSEIARKNAIPRHAAERLKQSAWKKLYVFLKYPLLMGFSADNLPEAEFKNQEDASQQAQKIRQSFRGK